MSLPLISPIPWQLRASTKQDGFRVIAENITALSLIVRDLIN